VQQYHLTIVTVMTKATVISEQPDLTDSARGRRMLRARRELASAAVRLFEERGFAETTVEEIAEAADYSASTFFRHFGTKEDAVFHDMGERVPTYRALLDDPPPNKETWPRTRAVLLENAAYWEDSDPEFARARTRLFFREPVLYRRYLAYCDEIERILTQVLANQRGTKPEKDVSCEVIAAAAVGAFRAGFAKWLDSGGRLEDHVAAGLDVIEPIIKP
jgi:AcrR family transcriptional regulator